MVISTVIGLVASIPALLHLDGVVPRVMIVLFLATGIARLILASAIYFFGIDLRRSQIAKISSLGIFTYSALFGLSAGALVLADVPEPVRWLFIVNALCFGIGNAARVADEKSRSLKLLTTVLAPLACACLWSGTWFDLLLALTIVLILPGMYSVTTYASGIRQTLQHESRRNHELALRMEKMAYTDPLTGLANRAGLLRCLRSILEKEGKPVGQAAVFWLDLDHFKQVNDIFGHPTGDRVLIEIADRMRVSFDPQRMCLARFGGDEFVVACTVGCEQDALTLADEAIDHLNRPLTIDGRKLDIGVSIGLSLADENGNDLESLLQAADIALYRAKNNGRGVVEVFQSDMLQELVSRQRLAKDLRSAIERGELEIVYQPIVDLKHGRILSFEALARWHHPTRGAIPPSVFIPIAEETGFITTLGSWVLHEAARVAAFWPEDIRIAVNLSPAQICLPGMQFAILQAIESARISPNRVVLEVTESIFMENTEEIQCFIEYLTARGINFAIDDFGAGYSSIGYISRFPFSRIKIDRSFISGQLAGRRSNAIIRAAVELACQLDMQIVAEGVETREQRDAVREMGCCAAQGYFFHRPMSEADALALVSLQMKQNSDCAA